MGTPSGGGATHDPLAVPPPDRPRRRALRADPHRGRLPPADPDVPHWRGCRDVSALCAGGGGMREKILRVQDRNGRGPWRPGFSDRWTDAWRITLPAPIYDEVPNFRNIVNEASKAGLHIGCASRGFKGLALWFSQIELLRLYEYGFQVFDASECDVLAETETQVLLSSKKPLKSLHILAGKVPA